MGEVEKGGRRWEGSKGGGIGRGKGSRREADEGGKEVRGKEGEKET